MFVPLGNEHYFKLFVIFFFKYIKIIFFLIYIKILKLEFEARKKNKSILIF
jgi:hypothetical protein